MCERKNEPLDRKHVVRFLTKQWLPVSFLGFIPSEPQRNHVKIRILGLNPWRF